MSHSGWSVPDSELILSCPVHVRSFAHYSWHILNNEATDSRSLLTTWLWSCAPTTRLCLSNCSGPWTLSIRCKHTLLFFKHKFRPAAKKSTLAAGYYGYSLPGCTQNLFLAHSHHERLLIPTSSLSIEQHWLRHMEGRPTWFLYQAVPEWYQQGHWTLFWSLVASISHRTQILRVGKGHYFAHICWPLCQRAWKGQNKGYVVRNWRCTPRVEYRGEYREYRQFNCILCWGMFLMDNHSTHWWNRYLPKLMLGSTLI